MNDQENIKRIHEWDKIRKEMEAGSTDLTQEDINYFEDKGLPTMASILQELKKELKTHSNACAEFDKQEWQEPTESGIALGWCEALEFAIKTIKRHNKGCEADQ